LTTQKRIKVNLCYEVGITDATTRSPCSVSARAFQSVILARVLEWFASLNLQEFSAFCSLRLSVQLEAKDPSASTLARASATDSAGFARRNFPASSLLLPPLEGLPAVFSQRHAGPDPGGSPASGSCLWLQRTGPRCAIYQRNMHLPGKGWLAARPWRLLPPGSLCGQAANPWCALLQLTRMRDRFPR
jgi:hypothetical protein